MYRYLIAQLLFATVFVGVGCSDEDVPTVTTTQRATFPNEVGDLWTYQHRDLVTGEYDTVDVVVIRDTVLPNGDTSRIWVYRYQKGAVPDTQIVSTVGDTIKLYWHTPPYLLTLLLPLDTSDEWTSGVNYADTATISGPIWFDVQGVTHKNTYWIRREYTELEGGEESNIFVVPEVGLVQVALHVNFPMNGWPEINQSWELLSYEFD